MAPRRKEAVKAVETEAKKEMAVKAEAVEASKEVKVAPTKKAAPAKKAAAPKAMKSAMYVQFAGKQFTESELVAAAKKAYMGLGHKAGDIKSLEVYLKPEESVAYYVVNGEGSDDYKIEL